MFARGYGAASLVVLLPLTTALGSTPVAAALPLTSSAGCATSIASRLDQRGRVGQLLMIGVPVDSTAAAAQAITSYDVGSIFLAGRSYRSVGSIRVSTDAIVRAARIATGVPAYVAADQEGGLVQSLRGPGFTRIASAERQGALPVAMLRAQTLAWSAELRAAGISLDLAPVTDTVSITPPTANPPIGALHRAYGTTPDVVARSVTTVVAAMQSQGVAATMKHFPGLGRVRVNTDASSAAVDTVATATDPNLAPFAAGIKAGAQAVMMSSAHYPHLDATQPAVLSPRIVTGLLQQQLGFTGLIVTDDIGAAAALSGVPLGERAIRFIDAGGQVVLSVRPADAGPLSRALIAHAQADPAFRRRVNVAVTRVVQTKIDAGLIPCGP